MLIFRHMSGFPLNINSIAHMRFFVFRYYVRIFFSRMLQQQIFSTGGLFLAQSRYFASLYQIF